MKYIITYENFTPIKINSAKPFKVKKNIDKNIKYVQKGIRSLKKRKMEQTDARKSSDMNADLNAKMKKLRDLNFKKAKQIEHFRNNPIKESLDESEESETLLSFLTSSDFKPEDIDNHMGFNNDEYEFELEYERVGQEYKYVFSSNFFKFKFKMSELEELMNLENGVLSYLIRLNGYGSSGSEYDISDDELNYLHQHINDENKESIKELANLFDYKININEPGEIYNLFNYLGLNKELDNFKSEIKMENERAADKVANDMIKSLPFKIEEKYGNLDIELTFYYKNMIEYIKENDLEDVKTIKEFIENIKESNDISYDVEDGKYEYLDDFVDLNTEVLNDVANYVDSPENIFPNLIKIDNLKLIKKKIDLANFIYSYDFYVTSYEKEKLTLFEIAKICDNSVLKWFKTYNFQNKIIDKSDDKIYLSLQRSEIINPKIEQEYSYLIDSGKYNL